MSKQVLYRDHYIAEIESITERDGKNGLYLMWRFKTDTGESLVGFTDADVAIGNRTWNWIANLGVILHIGEYVDFKDLVGIPCTIFVDEKRTVRLVTKEKMKDNTIKTVAPTSTSNITQPKPKENPVQQKAPQETSAEDLFN